MVYVHLTAGRRHLPQRYVAETYSRTEVIYDQNDRFRRITLLRPQETPPKRLWQLPLNFVGYEVRQRIVDAAVLRTLSMSPVSTGQISSESVLPTRAQAFSLSMLQEMLPAARGAGERPELGAVAATTFFPMSPLVFCNVANFPDGDRPKPYLGDWRTSETLDRAEREAPFCADHDLHHPREGI